MTTETTRTTPEEIANHYWRPGSEIHEAGLAAVREAFALGAASRASPKAPPDGFASYESAYTETVRLLTEALEGLPEAEADLPMPRAARRAVAAITRLRASPEEGRECEECHGTGLAISYGPRRCDECSGTGRPLRSPPALTEEARASMPPRGTVIEGAIFAVGEIYGFPVGRRTVTVELDRDPGPIRFRERVTVAWGAPPPEDSGARPRGCPACGGTVTEVGYNVSTPAQEVVGECESCHARWLLRVSKAEWLRAPAASKEVGR